MEQKRWRTHAIGSAIVLTLAALVGLGGHEHARSGRDLRDAAPMRARASARRLELEGSQRSADPSYDARSVGELVRATNAQQSFDVEVENGGARIRGEDDLALTLALRSIGRAGVAVDVAPIHASAEGNRIHVARGGVLEWFANGPLGLEQGFELAEPPRGAGPIRVTLDVSGLRAELVGDHVALRDDADQERARYSDLYALDAEGDELPASMHVEEGRIVLEVDDTGAAYPLVIDPLVTTQQARLGVAESPKSGRYGAAVSASTTSIQGSYTVVGAPFDDRAGVDAGAAYLYKRNAANDGWDFVTRLSASDAQAGAHFGAAVAVGATSGTQIRVLVGAPDRATGGKVYAYTFTTATMTLASTTTFSAPASAPGDEYGAAIAYNFIVGATAFAVGAPGPTTSPGAVHVYRNGALEASLTPVGGAAGDRFGAVLAPLYRDAGALVVGSPGDDASAAIADSGSVYSFVRAVGPPVAWAQEAKVSAATPQASARFGGSAFALSMTEFLVGEPGRTNGVVHRLVRSNGSFTIAASIQAADGAAGDGFGSCVSFAEAGANDHVIIGAPGVDLGGFFTGQGALYRYTLDAALTATFVERFTGSQPGEGAGTTCSMVMSDSGSPPPVALFGVPFDDSEGTDAGGVRVENFGTNATESDLSPDSIVGNRLGRSVAIDGDTLVVGAPYDDDAGTNSGAVYVFVRSSGVWSQQAKLSVSLAQLLGGSVALEGDVLVMGTQGGAGNAVYVSRRSGSTWSTPALLPPSPSAPGDAFGASLSLRGGTLAVGAPGVNGAGTDRGAVFVFVDVGGVFTQQATFTGSTTQDLDIFGYAVSVDGNILVAGAPGRDGGGGAADIGIAYVFARSGTTWTEQAILAGPPGAGSAFGKAVFVDGTRVVVGAPAVPVGGVASGAGSVRSFTQNGFLWPLEGTITLAGGVTGDELGASIALRSGVLVLGAPGRENGGVTDVGAVVPHLLVGNTWTAQTAITEPGADDANSDDFGRSVALSNGTLATGAPLLDVDASDAGGVYVHLVVKSNGDACGAGSECSSGFCVDGVCCNVACAGGTSDCQACSAAAGGTSNGTCTALSAAAAPTITCRAANASGCDVAESCVAGNVACPADASVANGTACGGAPSGVCDSQDVCMGGTCQAVFVASGTTCRGTGGNACDVAEVCTGSSASCPADGFVANGTACGGAPSGACDAQDVCMTGACQAKVAAAGTPCRASNGECDAVETCDGSTVACPVDDPNAKNGQMCGAAVEPGGCDVADSCNAGVCVVNVVPGGTSCRPSTGTCDSEERCIGTSPLCPSDVNTCCTADAQCNDGNPCTPDSCDVATGACVAGAPTAGCCVADAECTGGSACMPTSCDLVTNACITDDLGPTCCDSPADCSDGDPCTVDDCSANACTHVADAACNVPDAGVGTDAGVATDAGVDAGSVDAGVDVDSGAAVDAGSTPPARASGCGCALAGRTSDASLATLAALAVLGSLVVRRRQR